MKTPLAAMTFFAASVSMSIGQAQIQETLDGSIFVNPVEQQFGQEITLQPNSIYHYDENGELKLLVWGEDTVDISRLGQIYSGMLGTSGGASPKVSISIVNRNLIISIPFSMIPEE